jgi:hypothetical protein
MKALALGLFALALLPAAAHAATANGSRMESKYTDIDFDECTTIEADDMGATSACPGYKGYPVVIGEGDLRMFVSFGIKPTEEKAAEQTLGPFNHLGKKIEWRIETDDDTWQPRATIIRWFTAGEDGSDKTGGQVLVVTQIKLGATCQIALIDAQAVKDANEKARQIADANAGSYDCSKEPEVIQPFKAF